VRPPLVTIEAGIDERPVRLLIDTGANAVVLFSSTLLKLDTNWPVTGEVRFEPEVCSSTCTRAA
jgi:hypothetical protein